MTSSSGSHVITLHRLQFIDFFDAGAASTTTKMEGNVWAKILCGNAVMAMTPPKPLRENSLVWDEGEASVTVPLEECTSLLFVLSSTTGTGVGSAFGMASWNGAAYLSTKKDAGYVTVHVFPMNQCAVTSPAVLAFSVHTDGNTTEQAVEKTVGNLHYMPQKFFIPHHIVEEFPSCFVSNVLCVQNKGNEPVSIQLRSSLSALLIVPASKLVVPPAGRVFISATWNAPLGDLSLSRSDLAVELVTAQSIESIPLHFSAPSGDLLVASYHYWVNRCCVTNCGREMSELPEVHHVLPAFQNTARWEHGHAHAAISGAAHETSDHASSAASRSDSLSEPGDTSLLEFPCECVLDLGVMQGMPVLHPGLRGTMREFRIVAISLDGRWRVRIGETCAVRQFASGALRWPQPLTFVRLPGAKSTQFLRLILMESTPEGRDEIPVAAALVSAPSLMHAGGSVPLHLAFYVYDSFSLYDQLGNPSMILKGASLSVGSVAG